MLVVMWKRQYQEKLRLPEEAVKEIKNGDRVYIGYASSVAIVLSEALAKRKEEVDNVTILTALNNRHMSLLDFDEQSNWKCISFFAGQMERKGIQKHKSDFTSFHLSQIDYWFRHVANPNVAFLEVSPPDENGYMSYGACGTATNVFAKEMADIIILQVNNNVPYVYGKDNLIHVSEANYIVEADCNLTVVPESSNEQAQKIANIILEMVPDGATIQLGIGSVSNAVGYGLKIKNDLGVHSEMYSDSMMMLQKEGNITNRYKNIHRGKSVAAFALGSSELYRYVDHNDSLYFAPFPYVNDPYIIGQNDKMISINTAMSIDIYGQIAADSIGWKQYSGIGGQLDYVRGAQISKGGKSIFAIPSTLQTKDGVRSRIVLTLPVGTAIATPRSDVEYVVTEFGCVNLKKLPMRERAKALISIAHPDFKNELEAQAKEHGLI